MENNQSSSPVIGIPVISSLDFAPEDRVEVPDRHGLCDECKLDKKDLVGNWIAKLRMKVNYRVHGVKEYVKSGARFLKAGRTERLFRKAFSVSGRDEKLVKSLQCYLSTTAGPIAGIVFISTHKIAFLSYRSLRLASVNGEVTKFPYKVVIPLSRVKGVIPIENSEMPAKIYVRVVTVDEFEFWFMGIVRHQLLYKNLQETTSGLQ